MRKLDLPRLVPARTADCPDCYIVHRGADAPVLIAVHGISRNAAEMASRFAESPHFSGWTIVAPLFEKSRFGQYQQLLAGPGQTRSDIAMLNLLDAIARDFGITTTSPAWFGFSGGAQFCHRFALLHPTRVSSAYCVSAGWYAMPDAQLAWPFGIGEGAPLPCDLADALSVRLTVAVGEQDLRIDGSVRQSPLINSHQGETRLRRAKRWTRAMQKVANGLGQPSGVKLELLSGGVHDFAACVRHTAMLSLAAAALATYEETSMAASA